MKTVVRKSQRGGKRHGAGRKKIKHFYFIHIIVKAKARKMANRAAFRLIVIHLSIRIVLRI